MFAILFSKGMDPFYDVFFSFPTIIFSFLVALSMLFSLVAMLGFIDLDILDLDVSVDGAEPSANGFDAGHVLAGLMMRFGLGGIPLILIVPILFFISWLMSFFVSYYTYDYIPNGVVEIVFGVIVFFVVIYCAAYITGKILRPFRKMFEVASQEVQKDIVGKVAVVRTSTVSESFGEATVEDGGAGLIVKVRTYNNENFKRGDQVVLIEYVVEEHSYKVVSKEEFNN